MNSIVRTVLRVTHKTKNSPQAYNLVKQTLFSAQALKTMPQKAQQTVALHSPRLFMIGIKSNFKPSMELARYLKSNPNLKKVFDAAKNASRKIATNHEEIVSKIKNGLK